MKTKTIAFPYQKKKNERKKQNLPLSPKTPPQNSLLFWEI